MTLSDEKVFSKLGKMGINTPAELLLHLPVSYVDCRVYRNLFELPFGQAELKIYPITVITYPDQKGVEPPRLEFIVEDVNGTRANAVVFGAIKEWKSIAPGQKMYLRGKLGEFRNELSLTELSKIERSWIGKVIPQYKGKKNLISSEYISNQIYTNLHRVEDAAKYLRDYFNGMSDKDVLSNAHLTQYGCFLDFLNAVHKPSSIKQATDALAGAKKLSAYEIVWLSQKRAMKAPEPLSVINIDDSVVNHLISQLPFNFTKDQENAVQIICDGLKSQYALFTLLSGDVGTGKTAVFGVCAAAAKQANAKVVILLPNILLVKQTEKKLNQWWPSIPTLSIHNKSKITNDDLANNPVVLGTTAMFSRLEKLGWVPDFVIPDEQAKFGVSQRERLVASHTNLLEATATCVPRSAALIMNGGMDMVVLKECPAKKSIVSRIIGKNERERLITHIRKVIEAGGQAAILYPNVKVTAKNISKMEEAKASDKRYVGAKKKNSAAETVEMWNKLFPDRVGLIHGQMTDDEKINVIEALERKEIDLLISTTIIVSLDDSFRMKTCH